MSFNFLKLNVLVVCFCLIGIASSAVGRSSEEIQANHQIKSMEKTYLKIQSLFQEMNIEMPRQIEEAFKETKKEILAYKQKKMFTLVYRICCDKNMRFTKICSILEKMRKAKELYSLCHDSRFYKKYIDISQSLLSKNIDGLQKTTKDKTYYRNCNDEYRILNILENTLRLLQQQREIDSPGNTRLHSIPKDSQLMKDFNTFCEKFLKKTDEWLDNYLKSKTSSYPNKWSDYNTAWSYWKEILYSQHELIQNEKNFEILKGTDIYKSYVSSICQYQDLEKKLINLLMAEKQNKMQISLLREEIRELRDTTRKMSSNLQASLIIQKQKQAVINNTLEKYPVLEKSDYPARIKDIFEKIDENSRLLTKATSEKRKVLQELAKCKIEKLKRKLKFLSEGAKTEAYILELLDSGEISVSDKEYLNTVIARLKEIRTKYENSELEAIDLTNKIRMLELKAEIMENEHEKLEEEYDETRENFYEIADRIKKHIKNSKNFEDARKISIDDPISAKLRQSGGKK